MTLRWRCAQAHAHTHPHTRTHIHTHTHTNKHKHTHERTHEHTRSREKAISGNTLSGIDVRGMLLWALIIRMRGTANLPCFMQLCCVAVLVNSGDKAASCSGLAASGSCRLGPLILYLSFDQSNSADEGGGKGG